LRQWIRGHQESRRERNRKLIAKRTASTSPAGRISPRCCCAKAMRSEVKTNQEVFDLYLADNASASVERDRAGTGGRRAVAEMTAR